MDFQTFKTQASKEFKLSLNSYKEVQLKRRIDNLIFRNQSKSYQEYFNKLRQDKLVFKEFIDYITINVSEFFRNPQIFEVLEKKILPEILTRRTRLKIWSAACSNGSEPYSIGMILDGMNAGLLYSIEATDLDENILQRAQTGIYGLEDLKNVSSERLKKYFRTNDGQYEISRALKSKIKFRKHDLLLDTYNNNFDLIVCRNVTIYFTREAQEQINKKFFDSLNPGGYLFIGGTESIFNHKSLGFEKVSTCFYQKQ